MSEEATLDGSTDMDNQESDGEHRITGFGTFPSEWDKKDITECAKIRDSERIPLNSREREQKKPGEIPYYGANGVLDYIDEYIFDSELILLAEDGGHFEEYQERPIAYRISGKSWVNNHAHILEAQEGTVTDHLFYSLEYRNLVPYVSGSTRSKLTQSMLRKVKIPSPPLPEQRKIATVLYTVDRAIEKTEDIIRQTKNIRDGLRQSAFESGIKETGGFRDLSDDMRKETRIGSIPQNWEFLRLDEVCSDVVDCLNTTPEYSDSGIRVILTSEIEDGRYNPESSPYVTEEVYKERIRRIEPQPGDVIFTREAPIGEAFKIPEGERLCLGQRTMQLRPKEGTLDSNFLLELLYSKKMQSWFQRVAVGSTTKHMRVGDVEGMKIPVPGIREQERIASLLGSYRDYIETNMRYADQLKRLKRGLMQDLLSGTVRTTDTNIEVPEEIAQYG